jgi:hypothetical protein
MRRTSIIPAGNSRIGGSALPPHESRAYNDRRDASGETHCAEQIARPASAGLLMPRYMFL